MAGRWKNLFRFPVDTSLIPALHATASLLADFFDEEGGAAGRTSLGNGTVPQGKFAGRIFAAGKERTALARPLLDKIPAATRLGAFHTERRSFRCFAFRIGRAGDELPETAGLHHHRAPAFFADLIGGELLLRNNFDRAVWQLLEVLGIFTGRIVLIARTG